MKTEKAYIEDRIDYLSKLIKHETDDDIKVHVSMMLRSLKLYHWHLSEYTELNDKK